MSAPVEPMGLERDVRTTLDVLHDAEARGEHEMANIIRCDLHAAVRAILADDTAGIRQSLADSLWRSMLSDALAKLK